eukprot:TRINITY_DN16310_c0_g3_i1.p1 TRINITY_DN16310_c0_g3~~TRINITY_DN16310_c0_g3_i1.p1  ORF type:complete len:413 (-),score=69.77 TRINITY_DN16310_c0_g3_i1:303-1541(-)
MAATAVVTQLWCYPIKACQGCRLSTATVSGSGIEHDRAWCVVDLDGTRYKQCEQLSQRKLSYLATIQTELSNGELRIGADGKDGVCVPLDPEAYMGNQAVLVECGSKSTTSAGAWQLGTLEGRIADDAVNTWLSEHLNTVDVGKRGKPAARYALVRSMGCRRMSEWAGPSQVGFSEDLNRQRDGTGSPFKMQHVPVQQGDEVRFTDFSAFHLANEDSLAQVEKQMGIGPYPLGAFRPNIVVSTAQGTGQPWAEEDWLEFGIRGQDGEMEFRKFKNTPRCSVPARNPKTGGWVHEARRLLVQGTLRHMFPEKCLDQEWGAEWEGPCFGVHVGNAGACGSLSEGDRLFVHRSARKSRLPKYFWQAVCIGLAVLAIHFFCFGFSLYFLGLGEDPDANSAQDFASTARRSMNKFEN